MKKNVSKTLIALFGAAIGLSLSPAPTFAGSAQWNFAPGTGDWNTAINWTPATVPNGPTDTATFAVSPVVNLVSISANTEVNSILFTPLASAFTITAAPALTLTISGTGITNNSANTQNFVTAVDGAGNRGQIEFTNSATAGSQTVFTNKGATVSGPFLFGGKTEFHNTSTAGHGTFNNDAGTVSGAFGGATHFFDTSTAGNGVFNTSGAAVSGALQGQINFFNTSTGGNGIFTNNGAAVSGGAGGRTEVTDAANAGSGNFTNNGGTVSGAGGGFTEFFTTSATGAANGTFTNNGGTATGALGGFTEFHNATTAGNGTFVTNGGTVFNALGGFTIFMNTSTAANGNFTTNGGAPSGIFSGGITEFFNTSTAANGIFTVNAGAAIGAAGGEMDFFDSSTAANGTFTLKGGTISSSSGGNLVFHNSSTAANGSFTTDGGMVSGAFGSELDFLDGSTASNATFTTNGAAVAGAGGGIVEFHNTSTAASATFTTNGGATSGAGGGTLEFDETSTAANSMLTTNGGQVAGALGGNTQFFDSSTAGAATLIANGGMAGGGGGSIQFFAASTGGTARVEVFANGNLDISQHNLPGLTTGSIEGSGNVFLGANNLTIGSNNLSTTFSGVIQDGGNGTGGSLTKIGTATLILSGTNTYTGATNINGGVLQVDGSIASPSTFVNPGGTLRGIGTLGGSLTNSGIVGPGDSGPGTLRVSGNYTQNSNGTLQIQIGGTAPGQHDLLSIGGTASLNGTLQLVRLNNFTGAPGDKIIFLTATGGVSGTFATVNTDTIANVMVVYEPTDVALEFAQVSFSSLTGLTRNQKAVAHELDEVMNDSRANHLINFLTSEPLGNLPHDFDLIAPEELASIYETGFSQAVIQNSNLQHRMDDIRAGSNGFCAIGYQAQETGGYSKGSDGKTVLDKNPAPVLVPSTENRWGVFVTGSGDFVNVGNDDANAHGYDITTGNVTVGADYRLCDHFAIGIDGGYSGSSADLVDGGRVEVDGGKAGAYATVYGYKILGSLVHVDGAVSGGWNSYDTRRTGLEDLSVRGSTNGSEFNALLAYGGDWHFGCLLVGTWSSIQYTDVSIDRFTETGSLVPLQIQNQDEYSLRGTTGVRVAYDLKCGRTIFRPEVRAAWQHESGDRAYPIDARFASGAGDVFTVYGPTVGRDSALVDAGFAAQWSPRCSTYIYYNGVLGRSNYDNHAVSVGLRVSF